MLDDEEKKIYAVFEAMGWMHVREGVPWAPTADKWNGFCQLAYETGRLQAANVKMICDELPEWEVGKPKPPEVATLSFKAMITVGQACRLRKSKMSEEGRYEYL